MTINNSIMISKTIHIYTISTIFAHFASSTNHNITFIYNFAQRKQKPKI